MPPSAAPYFKQEVITMGFLDSVKGIADKVGDTVGKGVSSVSDGGKKLSEKIKVKNEIKSTEGDITKAYAEIGKLFFEKNASNPPEEYVEFINTITEKNTKLDSLRATLKTLEDKETCPSCGAAVDKGAKFCAKCGAKIESVPETVEAEVVETPSENGSEE